MSKQNETKQNKTKLFAAVSLALVRNGHSQCCTLAYRLVELTKYHQLKFLGCDIYPWSYSIVTIGNKIPNVFYNLCM